MTRKFFKGKKIWRYVSGTLVKPKNIDEGYVALIDALEANDTKIITWINNSTKSLFDSVVAGAFQITFRVKMHVNDVFLFF